MSIYSENETELTSLILKHFIILLLKLVEMELALLSVGKTSLDIFVSDIFS